MPTAYFRVESVLVQRTGLGCAAWFAARHARITHRITRLASVGLAAPIAAVAAPADAIRWAWRGLEGCSEDRWIVLGETYWTDRVLPALNPAGVALVHRCRAQGDRVVLVSDHPDAAIGRLQAHLGADELVCNRLQVRDGQLTGALRPPVITGRVDGQWIRAHAAARGDDPARCRGYGASAADATLLSGVGLPCAVTPDLALRRIATQFSWPIVEESP